MKYYEQQLKPLLADVSTLLNAWWTNFSWYVLFMYRSYMTSGVTKVRAVRGDLKNCHPNMDVNKGGRGFLNF